MDPLIYYCEHKYSTVSSIYEFSNTVSNLPFLFLAFQMEGIYRYFMVLLFAGSSLFHGTDPSFYIQLLDEIPMVFCLNIFIFRMRKEKRSKLFFYILDICFILFYIKYKDYELFKNYFTIKILYIMYIVPRNYMVTLSCIFLFVGKVCWSIEQEYCIYDNKLYILHSFWHIYSSISYYLMLKGTNKEYKEETLISMKNALKLNF